MTYVLVFMMPFCAFSENVISATLHYVSQDCVLLDKFYHVHWLNFVYYMYCSVVL